MPVQTRIIKIGNSKGLRIPKSLLKEADLSEDVQLSAEPGRLIVEGIRQPRSGWEEAARAMAIAGDDLLIDQPAPTTFDSEEWTW
ncbi:MAG: AbrB/MazE/SpoVT family DNA-binding domain-containing protein [Chloroflexi bacterium]|nr:AbrB/MazE/SpoVT family DNA-binding domain-containing protein [Chloroflexota bacterium]